MRRIGMLMNRAAESAEGQAWVAAFKHRLHQLGWTDGRDVRIDIRWGEDKIDLERKYAAELIALGPEIVFASGTLSVIALQGTTQNLPIVFVGVTDPVGASLVAPSGAPGWQCDRLHDLRIQFWRQKAGTAQAGCSRRDARGRSPRSLKSPGSAEFAAIQAWVPSCRRRST